MAAEQGRARKGGRAQVAAEGQNGRKAEIIEAGYRVVQKSGHKSLTFRSIADEAKVPLGSTTYYFTDKTDLLRAILLYGKERTEARYDRIVRALRNGAPVLDTVAEMVEAVTLHDHSGLVRDYELFLSGFDDEALSDVCRDWTLISRRALSPFLPEAVRDTLPILLEGIFLVSAKTGRAFPADEVRALMAPLFRPT